MLLQSFEQGVLTAADFSFFPAVWATAISLREQGVPYAVVDHGFTVEQLCTLEDQGVHIMEDCERKSYRKTVTQLRNDGPPDSAIPARAWHKPNVCQRSPFKHTVWIDADAIPLQAVDMLFDLGNFVTADYFVDPDWTIKNETRLCRRMGGLLNRQFALVNNGVFGFSDGAAWIEDWRAHCEIIVNAPSLSRNAICRDQSALVVSLSMGDPTIPKPSVQGEPMYNCPADGLRSRHCHRRLDCSISGPILLQQARERHPNAIVVHWMGPVKPWLIQSKSDLRQSTS